MKCLSPKTLCSLMLSVFFFSCVHSEQVSNEKIQSRRKIRSLETDLKKKQAAIDNLKEQNWILKQKYLADRVPSTTQKIPVPFQPSAAQIPGEDSAKLTQASVAQPVIAQAPQIPQTQQTPQIPQTPQTPQTLQAPQASQQPIKTEQAKVDEASPTDSHESAEHNLYAKVIASYRQKRTADLKRVTEILLKTYPQSVFADRAIFLNARLDFENANDPAAMAECDRIIRNYPNANKLVATYFLKAQILKKQGHILEAKSVLADVQNYFPGSPESYRVPLELKLLSLQAKAAK